ncbi:MAG TPA: hypothetical protein PK066_09315, partial [Saprospiraceae bacterium]|nr:hypothetical protein [Saprospiraceae bacterium]
MLEDKNQEPETLDDLSERENYDPEAVEIMEESEDLSATPHDDFDWSRGNRNIKSYAEDEYKKYESDYTDSLNSIAENEIVAGRVSAVLNGDIV